MTAAPVLPEKPKRKRPVAWIVVAAVVVVAIVVAVIVGAVRSGGSESTAAGGAQKTVTIGVADKSLGYWSTYTKLAKDELGQTAATYAIVDYDT